MITGSRVPESGLPEADRLSEPAYSSSPAIQTFFVPASPVRETLLYRAAKRLADVAIAFTALVVFMPLMILFGLLIWAEDHGPVLYRQARIGRYGVPFWFYKFRSMRVEANDVKLVPTRKADKGYKSKSDPRVTVVGQLIRKYSIDELPQLFTVLAGHMSIVGPRPQLRMEVARYREDQRCRLLVKPGLLCLREINGRSLVSFEDWVRMDVEYVENRSLLVDLKIFLLAIPAVLSGKGAY